MTAIGCPVRAAVSACPTPIVTLQMLKSPEMPKSGSENAR